MAKASELLDNAMLAIELDNPWLKKTVLTESHLGEQNLGGAIDISTKGLGDESAESFRRYL
jgi:hypothetical protein